MKKLLIITALVATFTGCGLQNTFKHIKSELIGLSRKITLFDANGGEIRTWSTRAKIEDNGGTCYFITADGKAVTISGTFVVEEL